MKTMFIRAAIVAALGFAAIAPAAYATPKPSSPSNNPQVSFGGGAVIGGAAVAGFSFNQNFATAQQAGGGQAFAKTENDSMGAANFRAGTEVGLGANFAGSASSLSSSGSLVNGNGSASSSTGGIAVGGVAGAAGLGGISFKNR